MNDSELLSENWLPKEWHGLSAHTDWLISRICQCHSRFGNTLIPGGADLAKY